MFEKRLKTISSKLGDSDSLFFVLRHKKHKREVYFQNNSNAIDFLQVKFDPSSKRFKKIKKISYFLIKAGILQLFLKKVKLSSGFGEVIFVANQIKGFDLKNKVVTSFTLKDSEKKEFLSLKKMQKKFGIKSFAPKILEINEKVPFSKEELLHSYKEGDYSNLFKKLYSFYKFNKIRKISLKKYVEAIEKKYPSEKVKSFLLKICSKDPKKKLLVSLPHGNFSKEQILVKGNSYVFTDWELESEKSLIIEDLVNFFREKHQRLGENYRGKDFLKDEDFRKILNLFPLEVKKDIKLYLLLNELNYDLKKGHLN